ncbi:hypothetical protein B7494_g5775 [Chlorociboria aeruginascens]|nr:hypothetical protein B7494_g5775 [Chlorociboria aeruginascens]
MSLIMSMTEAFFVRYLGESTALNMTSSNGSVIAFAITFACVGVLALIACIAGGVWAHRLWKRRGLHTYTFKRYSEQACVLREETTKVRRDVEKDAFSEINCPMEQDNDTQLEIRKEKMDVLREAEGWDESVKIALQAWKDALHAKDDEKDLESADGEVEMGKVESERVEKIARRQREKHGRYVIGVMRLKCMEGLAQRKALSSQLKKMHWEAISKQTKYEDVATAINLWKNIGKS